MKTSADLFLSLENGDGGFRFSPGSPATLVATSYCVLGLEFSGALEKMDHSKKSKIASFILSGATKDGYFRDKLFNQKDVMSSEHDPAYFEDETTAFCLQALDALKSGPVSALELPARWANAEALVSYLNSLPWKNPWLDSNRVMFALSRLCYEAEKGQTQHLASVDKALDWLDTQQDKITGLWRGRENAELNNAMAATVHFTFFYAYRKRSIQFADKIIDSCLSLQASHGLFDKWTVGHTCFDYDAVQLLDTASRQSDHRKKEVHDALSRAARATRALQNEDGGFADAKMRVRRFLGRPLPLFLSQKIVDERYNNCWKHLSCRSVESNAYSTWLRSIILFLADGRPKNGHSFRRLPFLGYIPP